MFLANAVYSCLMQFNMFFSSSQCNATRLNFNSMPFWGEALCGSAEVAQTFFSSRQSLAIFSQFELALHTACNLHWNFCFLMVSVFSLKRCIAWYIANPFLAKQLQKYAGSSMHDITLLNIANCWTKILRKLELNYQMNSDDAPVSLIAILRFWWK